MKSSLIPLCLILSMFAVNQAPGHAAETGTQAGAWIETGSDPDPVSISVTGSVSESAGPALGFLQDVQAARGEGTLFFHADETYENGYSWRYGGVAEPYYGAFAERYSGESEISSLVFDLTQVGAQNGQTMDVYVWDHMVGAPGAVLCALVDIDPGFIAFWPSISRHIVELTCDTGTQWWAGYWGNWPLAGSGWFIAADLDGPGGGDTFTNIAPGIGFPTGWQDVSIPWDPTQALGIGAIVNVTPPPTSLQSMIDAASPGETVHVAPGTYRGIGNKRLDFRGKDIVLLADGGPGSTIIDCESDGRAFFFHTGETAEAVVEGFTIRNGYVAGGSGGGVFVQGGASPTLRGLVIEGCGSGEGAAIAVVDGGVQVHDSKLENNEAGSNGGGSVRAENAIVLLENVTLRGAVEGGIRADQSQVVVSGGEIRGASSSLGGAAIRATSGSGVEVDFSVLTGNLAANGGAIYLDATSTAAISRSTLSSNRAVGNGGGIWSAGEVSLVRTIVWWNCSAEGGDDLYNAGEGTAVVECGAVDPTGVSGAVSWDGDQVMSDPMLCGPASCEAAPTVLGNVHLAEGSPGLPLYSPCGELLGPLWIRCPVPQIPTGACCLATSECFLTIEALCGPYGGFYAGDGSSCDPGGCEPADAPDPVLDSAARFQVRMTGPQPAASGVRFAVEVRESGPMRIEIYDAAGRRLTRVFDGSVPPGVREFDWNGRSGSGVEVTSGVYYLRVSLNDEEVTRRVVIAR